MNPWQLPAGAPWVKALIEAAIVVGVGVLSYQLAFRYLTQVDDQTLIDWELRPAVMASCGLGFVEPGGTSAARELFVQRKSGSISCAEFAWGGAPTPALAIASTNRYSIMGASWAMRWRGVSWETLDGYLAALFALAMSAVYGLYRMAVSRLLALFGVAAVACSTTLAEITVLREFIKLPCFAVLWLVLAWLLRSGFRHGAATSLWPMIVGGTLLGLGIGLRMDALVFIPVFPAVVLFVVPGFTRTDLLRKAAACVAFALAFLAAGLPILRSMSSGSNSAHVMVLGLMREFDPGLSIESPLYDIGQHYSDGFAYTVIASHGLLKQGEQMPIRLGEAKYDQIGNRLLRTMVRQFPADFMARALGATLQVFRYQFDWKIRKQAESLPTFDASPSVRTLVTWRNRILGLFEGREVALTVAVLVLASAFNWRLGVVGAALILYFCGYSLLQFARRHMFHLDVLSIFVVVLAIQLPLLLGWQVASRFRQGRDEGRQAARERLRQLALGAVAVAVVVLVGAGTLAATRWWQQRHVSSLIDATLAGPWTAVATHDIPLAPTILTDGRPVVTWESVYLADPERWSTGVLMRVDGVVPIGEEAAAPPDLRQRYYRVDLDGRCTAADVTVVVKYEAAEHTAQHEYIRAFTLPVTAAVESRLLVPAYYHLGPNWNRLDGFAVPAAQRACVGTVFRANDPAALPMPVMAFNLPPDWRDRPLYQRLMQKPLVTLTGTVVEPPR